MDKATTGLCWLFNSTNTQKLSPGNKLASLQLSANGWKVIWWFLRCSMRSVLLLSQLITPLISSLHPHLICTSKEASVSLKQKFIPLFLPFFSWFAIQFSINRNWHINSANANVTSFSNGKLFLLEIQLITV